MSNASNEGTHVLRVDFWGGLELELTLDYERPCAGNGGRGGWQLDSFQVDDGTAAGAALPDTWLENALQDALEGAVRNGDIPEVEALKRRVAEGSR